jgi:hypothetical protein
MAPTSTIKRCACVLGPALLAACASTEVTLTPSPQAPVCDRTATALVIWSPQWRPDQKDAQAREAAAASGLATFFAESGCFARTKIQRRGGITASAVAEDKAAPSASFDVVVTVTVRELGPVVRLLSSAALVDGGTEVVLDVSAQQLRTMQPRRDFTVRWRHGGPGVVKGVAGLPADMGSALQAALQPAPPRR